MDFEYIVISHSIIFWYIKYIKIKSDTLNNNETLLLTSSDYLIIIYQVSFLLILSMWSSDGPLPPSNINVRYNLKEK